MKTFEFKMQGGTTIEVDKDAITISIKGIKGRFFHRVKPRTKTIPLNEVLRLDYKGAGMTIGYLRVITKELLPYPSSMYVAEHDPNSFIYDKDERQKFSDLMDELNRVLPTVKKDLLKM